MTRGEGVEIEVMDKIGFIWYNRNRKEIIKKWVDSANSFPLYFLRICIHFFVNTSFFLLIHFIILPNFCLYTYIPTLIFNCAAWHNRIWTWHIELELELWLGQNRMWLGSVYSNVSSLCAFPTQEDNFINVSISVIFFHKSTRFWEET